VNPPRESLVCLNGHIAPEGEVSISVHDRGFLMGDGVYETVALYDGVPYLVPEHLRRLRASAGRLRIPVPYGDEEVVSWIGTLGRHNAPQGRSAARITLSRGVGDQALPPEKLTSPTLVITAGGRRPPAAEHYRRGVEVIVSRIRRMHRLSLDPLIKSTNLLNSLQARFEAQERGAYDAIFLNLDGAVAEGAFSNVFLIPEEGALVTPGLSEGILGGITRDVVLELARSLGWRTEERRVVPAELESAREVFLTASIMEIMPVVGVEGRGVGTGEIGPGTRALVRVYRERVETATGYRYGEGE
jgi:branched-chain amino acid aminotransferase